VSPGATLGDALADGLMSNGVPIVQDPHPTGPLSQPIYEQGAPLSPLNLELACLVNVVGL
jgi:hypothetical protein